MPAGLSTIRRPFTCLGYRDGRSDSDPRGVADEGEKLGTGFFLAEAADHGAGDGGGVLLLDAAHHHAQMARLDDDAHALRLDSFLNGVGDLTSEAFLHLQTASKHFN